MYVHFPGETIELLVIGCRGLDDAQFALLLTAKHAQRLLAISDPGQCLN